MGLGPPGRERGEGESIYGRGIRFFLFFFRCVRSSFFSLFLFYLFIWKFNFPFLITIIYFYFRIYTINVFQKFIN
jgi:hypothetical protein